MRDLSEGARIVPRVVGVFRGKGVGMEHEDMTTLMAPAALSEKQPASGPVAPAPRGQLWQAPVFVLGVGALLGVWFGRPLCADTPHRRFERDLAHARQILGRTDGDAEAALRHAQRAAEAAVNYPDQAGEAALLMGTAHVRLAERAAPSKASEHWQAAREHLREADKLGVPEPEKGRLAYRIAKVNFHTGEDMKLVLRQLEGSVAQADNRAEGYKLISQAALRLPKPDLAKALEANEKLRNLADASETELAAAKLLSGDLLLKMNKPELARKILEKLGDRAPAEMAVRAHLLCARSLQDEGKWGEAATLYQAALADQRAPVPEAMRPRIYLDLGRCYRRREQPTEAARQWAECVKRDKDSAEGQAAALLLSEVILLAPLPEREGDLTGEKAVELLTGALARVRRPADWNNPLLELARAREVLERSIQAFRQAGRFDLALKVTSAFERVSPPMTILVLRADLSAGWAQFRREVARQAGPSQRAVAEETAARGLSKQAADAYAEAAQIEGLGQDDRGKYLWASALNYQACQEHAKAIEKLKAFVELDQKSPQLGEAYYRLGEAHRQSGNADLAGQAYSLAMQHASGLHGRFCYLARYQYALALLASGDLDEAEGALDLNLRNMANMGPDPEAQEKSLYALGGLYYQRQNHRGAVRRLEEALHLFGKNAGALRARYQLADCYQQIAAKENLNVLLDVYKSPEARSHYEKEHRRWQLRAAEEFNNLSKLLDAPESKDQLTEDQRVMVPFSAAKCWFNAGEYQKALAIYEGLIERHRGKVEELDALGGAIRCHAGLQKQHLGQPLALEQPNLIRQRLVQIRKALPAHKDTVREAWGRWVEQASGSLNDMQARPAAPTPEGPPGPP